MCLCHVLNRAHLFHCSHPGSSAAVVCSDDNVCAETLREGSVCVGGFCTNPFYRGGCLANMLPRDQRPTSLRTCSSADGLDAELLGYCRPSLMNYTEIRIAPHNWASAYFSTWIVQIVLSELLNVPVYIETGDPDVVVDFYEEKKNLKFGNTSYDWEGLDVASSLNGDCHAVPDGSSCSHFFMEGWFDALPEIATELIQREKIELPLDLGVLGTTGNCTLAER